MKTITIKKEDEEITFRQTETTNTFLINGKKLRVYCHESSNDMEGTDYDIDEEDKKLLTDEEYEIFQDENIWDLARLKVGKVIKVNGWE